MDGARSIGVGGAHLDRAGAFVIGCTVLDCDGMTVTMMWRVVVGGCVECTGLVIVAALLRRIGEGSRWRNAVFSMADRDSGWSGGGSDGWCWSEKDRGGNE